MVYRYGFGFGYKYLLEWVWYGYGYGHENEYDIHNEIHLGVRVKRPMEVCALLLREALSPDGVRLVVLEDAPGGIKGMVDVALGTDVGNGQGTWFWGLEMFVT